MTDVPKWEIIGCHIFLRNRPSEKVKNEFMNPTEINNVFVGTTANSLTLLTNPTTT